MRLALSTGLIAGLALFACAAVADPVFGPDPTEPAFRALYKELVETNTTLSAGSCTLAAERMAALSAASRPAPRLAWLRPRADRSGSSAPWRRRAGRS